MFLKIGPLFKPRIFFKHYDLISNQLSCKTYLRGVATFFSIESADASLGKIFF